jgi:ABC-type antimicrobial peptide transport system permease subunit
MAVMSEATLVALAGAAAGIGAAFMAIRFLQDTPALRGVFQPDYTADVFVRALAIAFGMVVFGALYPAARAALLVPLSAIRHE